MRSLGAWGATALVVGGMIGSGVFLLPATLAPYGAASLLGWGVTLVGALLLAVVYAWLAADIPDHGGAYGYARAAFGDAAGFVVAWSYWVCNWARNAALAVAFAAALGALWPLAARWPAPSALAALWGCTLVSWAGVRQASAVQVVTTALKVVPLVLFGVLGLGAIGEGAYRPLNPSGAPLWEVASASGALTLWAFLGLEAATVPSSVIVDPARTVPRATVIGVSVAGLATLLACTVVLGLLPAEELARSPAPMVDAAARVWGPAAAQAVSAVAVVSCFGALNGWVLLQAQTPLAAARDGLFPAAFARVDARGTPRFGLLFSSALGTGLVVANYQASLVQLFAFSILLSTAAALVPYAVSMSAWLRLARGAARGRRAVAVGALVYSGWALLGTGAEALAWGAVLLGVGLVVWWGMRRSARR